LAVRLRGHDLLGKLGNIGAMLVDFIYGGPDFL